MKLRFTTISILSAAIIAAPLTFVEVRAESIIVSSQGDQSIQAPQNGLKMAQVSANYGEPIQKLPAVGDPPISRWIYQDFTVYFENDIVLHSVINQKPSDQTNPEESDNS